MSVWGVGEHRSWQRPEETWELGLQAAVNLWMWVLGTKQVSETGGGSLSHTELSVQT